MVGPFLDPRRAPTFAALLLVAALPAACGRQAPDPVLRSLPANATGAVSVDVAALLAWQPVTRDRSRLLGSFADGLLEAAAECGVGLVDGRVTVAWSADALTIVVAAPAAGKSSALTCMAGALAPLDIEPDGESFALSVDGLPLDAHAPDDDTLIVHVARTEGAEPARGSALGIDGDAPLAGALARVDHGSAIWAVSADGADEAWAAAFAGGTDVALNVALDDEGAIVAIEGAHVGGEDDAWGIRSAARDALAHVYMPSTLADRMDIEVGEQRVRLGVELASAEIYALDLRWLLEPDDKAAVLQPDARSPEALAVVQGWAQAQPVATTVVAQALLLGKHEPIGVQVCDAYVESFAKCIDEKLPEAVRDASKAALEVTIDAWKKAAVTPAGAEGLVSACSQAAAAVRHTCS